MWINHTIRVRHKIQSLGTTTTTAENRWATRTLVWRATSLICVCIESNKKQNVNSEKKFSRKKIARYLRERKYHRTTATMTSTSSKIVHSILFCRFALCLRVASSCFSICDNMTRLEIHSSVRCFRTGHLFFFFFIGRTLIVLMNQRWYVRNLKIPIVRLECFNGCKPFAKLKKAQWRYSMRMSSQVTSVNRKKKRGWWDRVKATNSHSSDEANIGRSDQFVCWNIFQVNGSNICSNTVRSVLKENPIRVLVCSRARHMSVEPISPLLHLNVFIRILSFFELLFVHSIRLNHRMISTSIEI